MNTTDPTKKQDFLRQIRDNKAKFLERRSLAAGQPNGLTQNSPDDFEEKKQTPEIVGEDRSITHDASHIPSTIRQLDPGDSSHLNLPVRKNQSQAFLPIASPMLQTEAAVASQRPSIRSQESNEVQRKGLFFLKPQAQQEQFNDIFATNKRVAGAAELSSEDQRSSIHNFSAIERQQHRLSTQMGPDAMPGLFSKMRRTVSSLFGGSPNFQSIPLQTLPDDPPAAQEIDEAKRKERVMKSVIDKFLATKKRNMEISYPHDYEQYEQVDIMKESDCAPSSCGGTTSKRKSTLVTAMNIKKASHPLIIPMDHSAKLLWNFTIVVIITIDSLLLPLELAFQDLKVPSWLEVIIVSAFLIDILLSMRTTRFLSGTGEVLRSPTEIRKDYLLSFGFLLDVLAACPFFLLQSSDSIIAGNLRLLRLLKLLRIQSFLGLHSQSEVVKLAVKATRLFFFLLVYIHLTACYHYHVAAADHLWVPTQKHFQEGGEDFYKSDLTTRYLTSLHAATLILMGNEVNPETNWHLAVVSLLSVTGALAIANVFGTITVIVQTLNRKSQKFQDKIDMANTSMGNMKLPSAIQEDIRDFMMSTHNNLDTQKELDQFMQMISPSLRNQVTKHIFLNAIASNPILQGSQEAIDFLINDITTLLYMPEDRIISQGEHGSRLYLIAKGDCQVWITDHMKQPHFIRQLDQGEYFGEVSILFQTPRTATVKSSNYCTMACLSKKTFFELCNNFPEIIAKMRERALKYSDPQKEFRCKVLQQVDYFKQASKVKPFFLDEVQFHLREENFEKGAEIIGPDCPLNQIVFMVQGKAELIVFDKEGYEVRLDKLEQGDVVGLHSVLYDETPIFSVVAMTRVRVLTLSQDFFLQNKDHLDGLKMAIFDCEDAVEENGVPLCDYRKFFRQDTLAEKLRRAKRKAVLLESCLGISAILSNKAEVKSPGVKRSSRRGSVAQRPGLRRTVSYEKIAPIQSIQSRARNSIMAGENSTLSRYLVKQTDLLIVPEISVSSHSSKYSNGSESSQSKQSSSSLEPTPQPSLSIKKKSVTASPDNEKRLNQAKKRRKSRKTKSDTVLNNSFHLAKSRRESEFSPGVTRRRDLTFAEDHENDLALYVCSEKSEEEHSEKSTRRGIQPEQRLPPIHHPQSSKLQISRKLSLTREGDKPTQSPRMRKSSRDSSASLSGFQALGARAISDARRQAKQLSSKMVT